MQIFYCIFQTNLMRIYRRDDDVSQLGVLGWWGLEGDICIDQNVCVCGVCVCVCVCVLCVCVCVCVNVPMPLK